MKKVIYQMQKGKGQGNTPGGGSTAGGDSNGVDDVGGDSKGDGDIRVNDKLSGKSGDLEQVPLEFRDALKHFYEGIEGIR